ncbi:hypothetical protein [Saliphagus infecundisoli]|uniref:Uncharacterized protein n=1 Tax=Saliphagus infecundisoli TaxID=1849069 RepID=A0ABD5QBX3_9EURY|nr:hypothetical protein [Saliphagus infecundisoli]
MVGRPTARGERAQLILVGAIALAFLIFGIVVVFNSAIYSQAAGQDGTVERAGEPPVVETEVEEGVRSVVRSVNADRNTTIERNDSNGSTNGSEGGNETENGSNGAVSQSENTSETVEQVDGNLTAFEGHYRNATAASRPVLANVNLSANDSNVGTIVHQDEFEDLAGNESRLVLNGTSEPYDVERFELTLNASEFEGLTVELGTQDDVEFGRNAENVTVSMGSNECELDPAAGVDENSTVTIDLLGGETDEGCLDDLGFEEEVTSVTFANGTGAIGTFELVVDAEEIDSEFAFGPAVLSVKADLTYESDELTYVREREIDVYGDEP